ncbi:restriction endonuclease subunit S [Convivina intestini]|uniref:Type I restriction enzyme S subunit n=1 Tax=Convivina intestini TaxID=1505726 RepID=A0A2U1DEZ0_9LACO|nr:restriction endonuclease subunit S [Convivina intestini]PVY86247.1 type I restriction enzyme S subunit [Convivina intestini]CAH1851234.1 hypothetical protein R077811_00251 [Convivina intestini]SDB81839.1 type I restriction enzyme, S subunit [Leuconostocaceae bacterium R-53105]
MTKSMKPSGVEWIGEIPSDWEITKIKYFTYMKGRIGWQGLKAEEFTEKGPYLVTGTDFKNGRVNWDTSYHISNIRYDEAPEIQLKKGDLLVTKDGTVGKLAFIDILPNKASLNSHLLVMRPLHNRYINLFLYYVLSSLEFENYFSLVSSGSTMSSLSQEKMGEFRFALPSLKEQEKIVSFLDEKISKLDEAKRLLNEQIEKLKEYRKSVIYQAVTKGLDPTVEMKDSGVEWIGEVPKGWEVKRFKYLYENANTGISITKNDWDKNGNQLIYTAGQLPIKGDFKFFPNNKLTTNLDILVARNGAGSIQIPKNNSLYTDHVIRFSLLSSVNRLFTFYVLKVGMEKIVSEQIDVSLKTLNKSEWDGLKMAVPSSEEQISIVDNLTRKICIVDRIIRNKELQVTVLTRQKNTLIYSYVTGKKQVK